MDPLAALARHGPWVLVAGLVAGLAVPPELNPLRDHIRPMVVVLLFLSVFRIEPRTLLGPMRGLPAVAASVLILQLALPLAVIAIGTLLGAAHSPVLLAVTLVTAAAPIVGSPNICVMMGVAPEHALRLLVVGTVLLPLTVLPVFWASASLDGISAVFRASLTLLVTLGATIGLAALARHRLAPALSPRNMARLDGLSALSLALFVIGLMPEIRQVALTDPLRASGWMGLALCTNWGAQIVAYRVLGDGAAWDRRVATSIYAGNRNVALFLVALPPETVAPVMVFVGCYQFPMYLTPMVMKALYRQRPPQV